MKYKHTHIFTSGMYITYWVAPEKSRNYIQGRISMSFYSFLVSICQCVPACLDNACPNAQEQCS